MTAVGISNSLQAHNFIYYSMMFLENSTPNQQSVFKSKAWLHEYMDDYIALSHWHALDELVLRFLHG